MFIGLAFICTFVPNYVLVYVLTHVLSFFCRPMISEEMGNMSS